MLNRHCLPRQVKLTDPKYHLMDVVILDTLISNNTMLLSDNVTSGSCSKVEGHVQKVFKITRTKTQIFCMLYGLAFIPWNYTIDLISNRED